jgi:hypothetical protein
MGGWHTLRILKGWTSLSCPLEVQRYRDDSRPSHVFSNCAKRWGTLDLFLVGGWSVFSLVMLSSLRMSYRFGFGAEGWVRTGVTQAAGGWIYIFGAWLLVICAWPVSPKARSWKLLRGRCSGWVTKASAAKAASFICFGGTLRLCSA